MRRAEAPHSAAREAEPPTPPRAPQARGARPASSSRARALRSAGLRGDQGRRRSASAPTSRTKTFFNHFATKQHLLREIAEQRSTTLFADIERGPQAAPAPRRERLRAFFRASPTTSTPPGPMRRDLVTEIIHVGARRAAAGSEQAAGCTPRSARWCATAAPRATCSREHPLEAQTELVLGASTP